MVLVGSGSSPTFDTNPGKWYGSVTLVFTALPVSGFLYKYLKTSFEFTDLRKPVFEYCHFFKFVPQQYAPLF